MSKDNGMQLEHLIQVLEFDEGNVLHIYKDSLGYYTVGIGHLLTKERDYNLAVAELDKLVGRKTNGKITREESHELLMEDIARFNEGINKSSMLSPIFNKLSPIRKIGLFSMCFQMGIKGVEGFKNSMRMIDNGDWERAEVNLRRSAWYRQTPNRAERVIQIITRENLKPYKIYTSTSN